MDIFENISGPSVHIYVTLYDKLPQFGLKWIGYNYEENIRQNKAKKTVSKVHNQFFPDIVFVKEAEHLKTFVYVYFCACICQCQHDWFIKISSENSKSKTSPPYFTDLTGCPRK